MRRVLLSILVVLWGLAAGEGFLTYLSRPPVEGVISCDDQPIVLQTVPFGGDPVRVLMIAPAESYGGYTDHSPGGWSGFADTLRALGFSVSIAPLSPDFAAELSDCDILLIYGYPGREFSPAELTAISDFIAGGGSVISVVRASPGDDAEIEAHNPVLNLVGMAYLPPRSDFMDTVDAAGGHPLCADVSQITAYRPMPISAAPEQQVLTLEDGTCILAADTTHGGKVVACGEENWFVNGPMIFGGVPVYFGAADDGVLALSLVMFCAEGHTPPGCGLDTAASSVIVDGTPYDFVSPELSWDGFRIEFSPGAGFWTSGEHTVRFEIADSCGNSAALEYNFTFDVDPPRATLIYPPTGVLISSGDSAIVFVQDYEHILDTAASYFVVDGTETLWLATHTTEGGFWVLPAAGWSVGDHEICVHAQDMPDYCPPNVLDSCFTITLDEDTLRTEIADVWVEGCSLVYVEVCVHSGDRYVKDLHLENFAFHENGEPVVPPSLELLNSCPSESARVDIVLLFDFSTSMNDEVFSFFGAIPSFVAALGHMDYRIAAVVFNGCPEQHWPDDGVWFVVRTDFSSTSCDYEPGGPDWWATNLTEFNCLYNAVVNDLYLWPATLRGSGDEDQYGAIVRANENLDFRDDALKVFILFTDERPIVDPDQCSPAWGPDEEGLDSIIQYCIDNDIVVLPVTPRDGEFVYAPSESPERRFYEGYYELGPATGGAWFYLWTDDYDTLATQIGLAIADLPCCYLFRYREEQFCRDLNTLVVDAFRGDTVYGRGDTVYAPPCPGIGEFFYPAPCGGITTCSHQGVALALVGEPDFFAPVESTLVLWVSPGGRFSTADDELTFRNDTLEYAPASPFHNGDTVWATLASGFDTAGCPIVSDTCWFVVDLQPPIFDSLYPAPGETVQTADITVRMFIYDSLAGVRWSEVGPENFEVFVDGVPAEFSVYSDHPFMYIHGFEVRNGDSVRVCAHNIPDDPTYDYCPPNTADTCWTFYVLVPFGPVAQIIIPPESTISACVDQQIWIAITDTDGVDSNTIVLVINGDTFTCADEELSFKDDTLRFYPPEGYWHNGETVRVQLIRADDIYGAELQNPLSWEFFLDFQPPAAAMTLPPDSSWVLDIYQPVQIDFSDNLAGVDVAACTLVVDAVRYPFDELAPVVAYDSLSGTVSFDPQGFGVRWFYGDTILVAAHLCDSPDTCGPNCAEFLWVFYLPPTEGCSRLPNPFTPNADGINDRCVFTFPGMYYQSGTVYIYDIHNALVRRIDVPAGLDAKSYAVWDGTDSRGNPVPPGVYLYVITCGGEVVCNGTVTVAR
ncbi:gliding motility-associated C-terminal domain-containing protein [bacterium]|nr:gliding motility-associated C-terminal domain-containing protein [bacterium]